MSELNTSVDHSNDYNTQKPPGVDQPAKVPIPTSDVGHKSTTVLPDSDDANNTLSFEDMLLLMVTQLQNQTIDNTADTNDMMNQIIQMTVMQAMTEMTSQVEELTTANIMSYSASLVGKEVTVGQYDSDGKLQEVVGLVTGTGTMNGQQVVEVDGDHAKGTAYCQVVLIGLNDGKRVQTTQGVWYEDKYVKQDGKWLIAGRTSHFTWTDAKEI